MDWSAERASDKSESDMGNRNVVSSVHTRRDSSSSSAASCSVLQCAGTVIENNRTLPYGEAWLADTASTNDRKFETYQRDAESGLDYAMDRYYENTGGRMRSPDRGKFDLFIPLSLNRYVYGMNDPINHVDADGNDPNRCHTEDGITTTCEGITPPPPITTGSMIIGSAGSGWAPVIAELKACR